MQTNRFRTRLKTPSGLRPADRSPKNSLLSMMTTTSTQTGIETRGVFKRLFERVSGNSHWNTVRPEPVEALYAKRLNSLGPSGVPAIDRSGWLIRTGLVLLIAAAALAVRPALADATGNPLDLLRQAACRSGSKRSNN